MTSLQQIEEIWEPIPDFPGYEVSNTGLVMNSNTNRILKTSLASGGALKVGMMGYDGRQHTRSVKVLVAEAFLPQDNPNFNTPINLNGDPTDCDVRNLAWRTRGFAWKYTEQYNDLDNIRLYRLKPGPWWIMDLDARIIYYDLIEAALANGLLIDYLRRAINNEEAVWPTNQRFVRYNPDYPVSQARYYKDIPYPVYH